MRSRKRGAGEERTNGAKGGSERDRRSAMIRRGTRGKGDYGTKGTSAAWGFGLARSTRYPFSACVSPESSLPVLASIRTSPSLLLPFPPRNPKRARARARARTPSLVVPPPLFSLPAPHDLTAWRATIAIAKPPLSCRLVPLPYLRSPTERQDGDASRRASLRSRHGDVTLSSVVQ